MNKNKLFTVNSQPRVNGASSTDPIFGWGPAKGFIYQKAYFEVFVPEGLLEPLIDFLAKDDMISYQAVNAIDKSFSNVEKNDVNAVTWGVFKNKEVIQPTVVDHQAFLIWKKEAFANWMDKWATVYEKDSDSFNLIKRVHDQCYLMNIVHNDYVQGDLNNVMLQFIAQN